MKKQNKDNRIVWILGISILVVLIVAGFVFVNDLKEDAYYSGWEDGQNNLVMSIRVSGDVPIFGELPGVSQYDWLPIEDICVRSGICTGWCEQLEVK